MESRIKNLWKLFYYGKKLKHFFGLSIVPNIITQKWGCSSSWIPLIQKWLRMTEERTKERNILFLQNWSVIIDISQSNFQKSFNTLMPMMSSSAELNPLADDHIFHRQRKSFITFENSFCRTHLSNAETWFLLKFSRFCTANIFNQVWKCFPVVSATYYIWNYLVSLHVYFQTSS